MRIRGGTFRTTLPIWALAALCAGSVSRAATPPTTAPTSPFGPNVIVLDPTTADAQQRVNEVFARQEKSQFGEGRYAILLKPGTYDLDIRLGYCTQVLGLGSAPDDVHVNGAVRVVQPDGWRTALVNFWRAAENLSVTPRDGTDVWAVSQGTALRRIHVKGDLALAENGFSSGGFIADSQTDGTVTSGSQQQWFTRNSDWAGWQGGNWNMVFVGVPHAPAGQWPAHPFTTIQDAPVIREKPYLTIDHDGQYAVIVPGLRRHAAGTTWAHPPAPPTDRRLPLSAFYIADPARDDAAKINAALEAGKHLLLTPGVYRLTDALHVRRPDTVVFSLGYATLLPTNGTPAITIDDVDGVTLAGLFADAGERESPTLIQVGPPGATASHADNPTALFDIFTRAGGAALGRVKTFVEINSADVIGDNFWLWRADHGKATAWDQSAAANGLVVNGHDVTLYGLFVEHTHAYQTLWNGDRGQCYFYQCELPYDPPSAQAWGNDARGYPGYKVADHVKTHAAYGLGIYSYFRRAPVLTHTAIEAPETPGVQFQNMIVVRLGRSQPNSGFRHTLNDRGEGTTTTEMSTRLMH